MGRSILGYAIHRMRQQDKWAEKYNPDGMFNVNQYEYETLYEYLDALRKEWKWELDTFDEYDDFIDISKYRKFEDYEEAVEACEAKKQWSDEHDPDNEFEDVKPYAFSSREEYLKALRTEWKWRANPRLRDMVDVKKFFSYYDYHEAIEELRKKGF